jgi:hypothetical protein
MTPLQTFFRRMPPVILGTLSGYYSLGFAYEIGLMHQIDLLAIPLLRSLAGRMAIGALMPLVQWYSAYVVQIGTGLTVGFLYLALEWTACRIYFKIYPPKNPPDVIQSPS